MNDSQPNSDGASAPKNPASLRARLLAAFAVNLLCLFLDSLGLLEWIPLPPQIQFVFLMSACIVASTIILYPTSLFHRRRRAARIALLCLFGIGIEVGAFIIVIIVFMIRNGLFPKR